MTLEKYAAVLRGIEHAPYNEGSYISHTTGRLGYRACFQVGGNWYWYSVSNTTEKIPPSAVADAITHGKCRRAGRYNAEGFEATISFGGHSYMIEMGSNKPTR